jgi:DNA repair protein RecO (recombination protein O)
MEGIIYKVQPYQETSKLVYVITREGKRTLIARGAQKMSSEFRVLTQYLTHIQFESSTKTMFTLKDAVLINHFDHIKTSLNHLKITAFVLELFDKLIIEEGPIPTLYQKLIDYLYKPAFELNSMRITFQFLYELGYDVSLDPDGRKINGFNIAQGRLIYEEEAYISDVSMSDLITLLHIKKTTYDTIIEITEETYQKLKKFMISYIEYHLNIRLKN